MAKINGVKVVYNNIPKTPSALDKAFEIALEAIGIHVSGAMQDNCSAVDTGNLRELIGWQVMAGGKEVRIGSGVEYAPYVEFGTGIYAEEGNGRQTPWAFQDSKGNWHMTRGQKPQPFIRPGFDQTKGDIQQICRDQVEQEFERLAKK